MASQVSRSNLTNDFRKGPLIFSVRPTQGARLGYYFPLREPWQALADCLESQPLGTDPLCTQSSNRHWSLNSARSHPLLSEKCPPLPASGNTAGLLFMKACQKHAPPSNTDFGSRHPLCPGKILSSPSYYQIEIKYVCTHIRVMNLNKYKVIKIRNEFMDSIWIQEPVPGKMPLKQTGVEICREASRGTTSEDQYLIQKPFPISPQKYR